MVVTKPLSIFKLIHYPHTNDLNPETEAEHHLDVMEFLEKLKADGILADLVIFDPPYSPRQIAECYSGIGRLTTQRDTQRVARWKDEKDIICELLHPGGIVLSFGWNSNGMGKGRGFEIEEILLVAHGSGHNDTICMSERKHSIHLL